MPKKTPLKQMELFPEIVQETAPKAIHALEKASVELDLRKLQNKVFVWDSSAKDLAYFHAAIKEWLLNGGYYDGEFLELRDLAWLLTWYANNRGETSKYLYFNEWNQKLYIDRDFWAWFKLKTELLREKPHLKSSKNNS